MEQKDEGSELPEPLKRLKETMGQYNIGEISETAGTVNDWTLRGFLIGGYTETAETMEKFGNIFTFINAINKTLDKNYGGALFDALSFIPEASPWVFALEQTNGVLHSQLVLGQAAFDDYQLTNYYLNKAHEAYLNGDDGLKDYYWK